MIHLIYPILFIICFLGSTKVSYLWIEYAKNHNLTYENADGYCELCIIACLFMLCGITLYTESMLYYNITFVFYIACFLAKIVEYLSIKTKTRHISKQISHHIIASFLSFVGLYLQNMSIIHVLMMLEGTALIIIPYTLLSPLRKKLRLTLYVTHRITIGCFRFVMVPNLLYQIGGIPLVSLYMVLLLWTVQYIIIPTLPRAKVN